MAKQVSIATLGSHSALNILKGAREEGFKAICVCRKQDEQVYRSFGVADEIILVDNFAELNSSKIVGQLEKLNAVIVPHGSFTAYLDIKELKLPIFGNRKLMEVEANRERQRDWLKNAGISIPAAVARPEQIDRLSIVKFHGARGGKGYFLADSYATFQRKAARLKAKGLLTESDLRNAHIQEYVIGVNTYFSFFNSVVRNELELLCIDKRYEANIDNIARLPAEDQLRIETDPTYTVTGNIPLVVRESLLPEIFAMGKKVCTSAKTYDAKGMFGPFCLESVINQDLKVVTFEISARIVAGTNTGIGTSPYAYLKHGPGMYMGRRIALELKEAQAQGMLEKVLT
ncbi:MAG: formate--phosphoribosylaminoimidazolecarboxamide ligase [Candidatus Aenigmarchaeota archaeon]|nr:formate--phosphoribosylaminoimidazolecarboxamide ligase [Candidatus Aenigmarchaeota archaeon]